MSNWGLVLLYLNRCPAELPCCRARWVVDEQRFTVPEAPTPRVHPAAKGRNGCLCCCDVVLLPILVGLIPAALEVVVMLVMVTSMAAALTWTDAGHSTQRPRQLSPRTTTGRLCPKTCWGAITAPCCKWAHTQTKCSYKYQTLNILFYILMHISTCLAQCMVWSNIFSSVIFGVLAFVISIFPGFYPRFSLISWRGLAPWSNLQWNFSPCLVQQCFRTPWFLVFCCFLSIFLFSLVF